jgi:hypothetical protein
MSPITATLGSKPHIMPRFLSPATRQFIAEIAGELDVSIEKLTPIAVSGFTDGLKYALAVRCDLGSDDPQEAKATPW